MSDEIPKLRIRIHRSETCTPVSIDGAWSGPVGTQEVFAAFYRDFPALPQTVIRDQTEKKETPETDSEYLEMTREVFLLAVMRPDVARAIGKLLIISADATEGESQPQSAKG